MTLNARYGLLICTAMLFIMSGKLSVAESQAVDAVVYTEYMRLVVLNNEDLLAEKNVVSKELEAIKRELAYQRASVGISGAVSEWIKSSSSSGYDEYLDLNVALRQEIDISGRFGAHAGYLMSGYNAAESAFMEKVNTVLAQATQYYIEASIAEERIIVQRDILKNRREILTLTKNKYEQGMVPKLDVIRSAQQVDDALALLERAGKDYSDSLSAMKRCAGGDVRPVSLDMEDIGFPALSLETALKQRPDLRKIRHTLAGAEYAVKLAAKGMSPKLQAVLSWGTSNASFSDYDRRLDTYEGKASLNLEVPVLDGGKTLHDTKSGAFRVQEMKHQVEAIIRYITEEVEKTKVFVDTSLNLIDIMSRKKSSTEESLLISEEMYKDGMIGQIDLINAQEANQKAQNEYIASTRELALAYAEQRRVAAGFLVFYSQEALDAAHERSMEKIKK